MRPNVVTRALSADAPAKAPREFRIFRAGKNKTSKGTVLFDSQAAKSVMRAFKESGNELMIDLEHQALGASDRSRADAPDARGWFKLAVRNGELWAVNVTWTLDGARRLRERTQRYISPAFTVDKDDRVREVINVALVAMPATHGAQPLAASKYGRHASRVVSARVTTAQLDALQRAADARGITVCDIVRQALDAIALRRDSADVLDDLRVALELGPDASPQMILAAVKELITAIEAKVRNPSQQPDEGGSGALAEGADPKPPTELSAARKRDFEACRKLHISMSEWRRRKRSAVRRSGVGL